MSCFLSCISFLIVTCVCLLTAVRCSSISCEPLSNASLYDWFQRANVDADNIFMISPASTKDITPEFMAHERLYSDANCPTSLPRNGPLDDRSTCPFYNVIDHDPRRYPVTLTKARCRCDGCLWMDDNYFCEHLVYNIRVLKSSGHCEGGFYHYYEDWYTVAVGCACAKRPAAPARRHSVGDIELDQDE